MTFGLSKNDQTSGRFRCIVGMFLSLGLLLQITVTAQNIPSDKVIAIETLADYLEDEVKDEVAKKGDISPAILARYFRETFSERFFYDYRTVDDRLAVYNKTYGNQAHHKSRALDHLAKYNDSTQWVLPFNYLDGKAVNAYALRHLARQHKMVDIAFFYFK